MFGAVSFLLDVAAVIGTAAAASADLPERTDIDCDDSRGAMGCRPIVDVVEEEGELVVLMEIPGFYGEDVKYKIFEDVLILVDSEDNEFHEVLLPAGYSLDEATCVNFNNGVTVIKFPRASVPCRLRKIA